MSFVHSSIRFSMNIFIERGICASKARRRQEKLPERESVTPPGFSMNIFIALSIQKVSQMFRQVERLAKRRRRRSCAGKRRGATALRGFREVGGELQGGFPSAEVSVTNAEGPPVPIPNTEVKLCSAENTCLATDWEDRSMPTQETAL